MLGQSSTLKTEYKGKRIEANKMNFQLNERCFLVKGAKRGAIYDLSSGEVYSINELATKFLEKCEEGLTFAQIIQLLPELSLQDLMEHIAYLERLNLGRFLQAGEVINKVPLRLQGSKLDFLWLELTSRCNLRCVHCYIAVPPQNRKVRINDRKRVMEDAAKLGCQKLQFIGGEPFLQRDLLFELIKWARLKGYKEIEIFSNGTLLDEETIQRLAKLDIRMAISFYSREAEIHDKITQVNNSYARTLNTLKRLKEAGIQTRIAIILMKINQDTLFETIEFLKNETGIENITYDLVRPIGRGCNPDIFPDGSVGKREIREPVFPRIGFEEFCTRINGHNCFSKSLCITDSGKVIPCIMARNLILGDILEESLQEIFKKPQTTNIRRLNKDEIDVCKNCEYRYVCFDCRPMAESCSGGNLYAKPQWCYYDPYFGEWEKS